MAYIQYLAQFMDQWRLGIHVSWSSWGVNSSSHGSKTDHHTQRKYRADTVRVKGQLGGQEKAAWEI